MPFIARDRSTHARIDITRYEKPREILVAADIICQFCTQPMIIRAGMIFRAHFAHKALCPTDYVGHPESHEHREGKSLVAARLREEIAEYSTAAIEFEVPIPEVKRIADIMVLFPNGWRVAHEIQLASLTTETLQQRTEDYLDAGVDLVWWLGKSADTPANRSWCEQYFGYSLRIDMSVLAGSLTDQQARLSPYADGASTL
jgi:competence CoiA-like predicted nuclease